MFGDINKPYQYTMGEDVFYIHRFPPFTAMKVLGEVQKVIAPILGGAAKGAKNTNVDGSDMELVGGLVGDALLELPSKLDGNKMESMARLLLNPDYVAVCKAGESKPVRLSEQVVDEVFIGRPVDMIILMGVVLKINFLDFTRLSGLPTGVRQVLDGVMKRFQAG